MYRRKKKIYIKKLNIFFKNNKFTNNLFRLFHNFVYKKDGNLYKQMKNCIQVNLYKEMEYFIKKKLNFKKVVH